MGNGLWGRNLKLSAEGNGVSTTSANVNAALWPCEMGEPLEKARALAADVSVPLPVLFLMRVPLSGLPYWAIGGGLQPGAGALILGMTSLGHSHRKSATTADNHQETH